MSDHILNSGAELLPIVAYGDALGLPYETQSAEDLRTRDVSVGLIAPRQADNEYFIDAEAGTWSDDTQQSLAVAESLAEMGEFNIDDIATRMIAEMHRSSAGWGKGSIKSLQRYEAGALPLEGAEDFGHEGGCGALMRLAPLVWWWHLRSEEYGPETMQQVSMLTRLTHGNKQAQVSAHAHAAMLSSLLSGATPEDSLDNALNVAGEVEDKYDIGREDALVSKKLAALLVAHAREGRITTERLQKIQSNPNKAFSGSDVLVVAYAGLLSEQSLQLGLFEVIEYGGDTDSSAAIFAPMAAAIEGGLEQQWPPHDYEALDDLPRLQRAGRALVERALENF